MQYAGAWRRFSASLADDFLLGIIVFMISFTLFDPGKWLDDAGVTFVTGLIYSLFVGSPHQATPGMRRQKIYVVRADGGRVGFGLAICRYLAFSVPLLFDAQDAWQFSVVGLFVKALWYLPILFDKQKAGVHDMICNTRVVLGTPILIPPQEGEG